MLHPSVGGVDEPGDVTCHLDLGLLKSTRAGQHNFIGLLATTVSDAGMRVFFELNSTQLRRGLPRVIGTAGLCAVSHGRSKSSACADDAAVVFLSLLAYRNLGAALGMNYRTDLHQAARGRRG
jgi:hypothetical protein